MIASNKTERDVVKVMADMLVGELGVGIVLGVENRTTKPLGDFVAITVISQGRQSSNEVHYPDRAGTTTHEADRVDLLFSNLVLQLDCYGDNSMTTANAIVMLIRSDNILKYGVVPLFCTDPNNLAFINSENQQEARWSIDATVQLNVQYRQEQDSATSISLDTFGNVDAGI